MVYQSGNTRLECGLFEEFQDYFKADCKQKTYTGGKRGLIVVSRFYIARHEEYSEL